MMFLRPNIERIQLPDRQYFVIISSSWLLNKQSQMGFSFPMDAPCERLNALPYLNSEGSAVFARNAAFGEKPLINCRKPDATTQPARSFSPSNRHLLLWKNGNGHSFQMPLSTKDGHFIFNTSCWFNLWIVSMLESKGNSRHLGSVVFGPTLSTCCFVPHLQLRAGRVRFVANILLASLSGDI